MKPFPGCRCAALLLVVLTVSAFCPAADEPAPPDGFTAIFDGRTLDGWQARPHVDPKELAAMTPEQRQEQHRVWMDEARQHWRVENGELVNDGDGPYLTTNEEYGDLEFLLEYRTVSGADSGIYLRGTPQVQIWDYTQEGGKWNRGADKGSGGLFNNSPGSVSKEPLVLADKPFGEWNRFRILQIGSRTSVWLNDQLVVDHAIMENFWDRTKPLAASGPIQLQTHGGEIRWRNLFVRRIPTQEAAELLAKRDADQFHPLFNGRNLDGWTGDVDSYQVADGSIVCREGQGGNLFTNDVYDDFVVRVEFRLPPGGNNGLAIRYPGAGRPSTEAMTELQILDDDDPRYASLDARQYHGSAYGLVPAHRGYLRPDGEWNFQEVTVRGSEIRVELNGVRILDADLGQVTGTKDNEPHPGRTLRSGHFGFAGHSDPVAIRSVSIRRLKPLEAIAAWPQFRGFNSSGCVDEPAGLPTEIGPDRNVVWKVELPPGHSSPVIFGDRIFVTAVRQPPTAQQGDNSVPAQQLVTICLDRTSGRILWERQAEYETLEKIHQIGSHAQSTPATDGERVISFFGSSGLYCYSPDGELLWQRRMGPFNNTFGAGSSPIIVDDRVILAQDHDTDSFLLAVDKNTGDTLWKTDRSEFPRSYSSPVILDAGGSKQIIVAGTLRVVGYDFSSGAEVWTVRGLSRSVCMTPVIARDGTLFVAGWSRGGDSDERISVEPFDELIASRDTNGNGTIEDSEMEPGGEIQQRFEQVDRDKSGSLTKEEYEYYRYLFDTARNVVLAIRPQGAGGDLTSSAVAWESQKFVPFCASPLACNGYLFTVKDGGITVACDGRTGKQLSMKRISGTGNYYASPVSADGRVYLIDQRGKLTVVGAYAELPEISRADFGEDVYATPAICKNRIYVRTVGHLYCFGQ